MRTKQKGFSLIELLIVVAIILIIAAIAIPNLLRAKMAANESSAVGSLRTINTVEVKYATDYGTFSPNMVDLGGEQLAPAAPTSTTAQLLDSTLASDPAVKSGYTITYTAANANNTYTITANPTTPGSTGINYFYTDQTTVIRKNGTQQATVADPAIQ